MLRFLLVRRSCAVIGGYVGGELELGAVWVGLLDPLLFRSFLSPDMILLPCEACKYTTLLALRAGVLRMEVAEPKPWCDHCYKLGFSSCSEAVV